MTGPEVPLIAFVIMCGLTMFYLLKTRHIERITRIEHGMEGPIPGTNLVRSFGLFLIGMASGLFCAFIASKIYPLPDYIFIPGFVLLWGGMGLLLANRLNKRDQA